MPFPAYQRTVLDLATARDKVAVVVGGKYLEFAKVANAFTIHIGGPEAESITINGPRIFNFCAEVEQIFITNDIGFGTVEIITTDEFTSTLSAFGTDSGISDFAKGIRKYSTYRQIGAPAVARFPGIQLINPTGSDELWTVTRIFVRPEIHVGFGPGTPLPFEIYGQLPTVGVPVAHFPDAAAAFAKDSRVSPSSIANVGSSGQSVVATGVPVNHDLIGAAASATSDSVTAASKKFKYEFPPDGSFVIVTSDDNNWHTIGIDFNIRPL